MVTLKQNTAMQFCPGLDKPSMGGIIIKVIEKTTPQMIKMFFSSLPIRF